MKVLICGGRTFASPEDQDPHHYKLQTSYYKDRCFRLYEVRKPTLIIHGNANGADKIIGEYLCSTYCIPTVAVPADWKLNGKTAGPIRNRKMLIDWEPDMVIAFPGGKGTTNMIEQAKDFRVEKVVDLEEDYTKYMLGAP